MMDTWQKMQYDKLIGEGDSYAESIAVKANDYRDDIPRRKAQNAERQRRDVIYEPYK